MAHFIGDNLMTGMAAPFNFFQQPVAPKFFFKFPKVVEDQKGKFETDDFFRKLSRNSEIKYTSHSDRPLDERQKNFIAGCRKGHTEIAFVNTGTSLQLVFANEPNECNFEKEPGKVHIKSHLIMNGVCVMWRGCINLHNLSGIGRLEYDEECATKEAAKLFNPAAPLNSRMQFSNRTTDYQYNHQHLMQQQQQQQHNHYRVPS